MAQAIVTKYHGPTNTRGSRISARCNARRIYVAWDYELDVDANHWAAAMRPVRIMGWGGEWVCGSLPDACADYACFIDATRSNRVAGLL